jgi:hypothetical protein
MKIFFENLEKKFFTTPLLKTISQGKFFTTAFSWILRICAVLTVIGFLYYSVNLWVLFANSSGSLSNQLAGFFGKPKTVNIFFIAFFAQIFAVPLAYIMVNIFLIKANEIDSLPLQKEYIVVPVAVILIKTIGELLAAFASIAGVYMTIALLFGNEKIVLSLMGFGSLTVFTGVTFEYFAFIGGPLIGFIMLVVFYSIAELVGALVDIARNTKKKA